VLASADVTICPGQSSSLNASGALTYSWNPPGSLNNSNSSNPIAAPTISTLYIVTGTDTNGCTNQDTVNVNVGTQPLALFTQTPSLSCEGIYFTFKDSSTNANTWYWNFGDGTTSTQQNPVHTFPSNSTYTVTLIVTNPPCRDTLQNPINIGDMVASIAPANVFTPNKDGRNDCFHPVITGGTVNLLGPCIHLEIYDRWGIKMFESDDTKLCWDGNNRHNKEAAEGTYYYTATFEQTTIKGFVELLR